MSEKFGQNPNNNTEQGSSPKEVTWDGVVAAGEALEDEAEATAEPTMDSQKKTRDERIADGQEKVAALRNKAKEGLGRVWKGLKDSFYIGVSRGSELPGQIAEGAGRAKEQIGNTLSEARNKAAELFAGGREFILQKASEPVREKKKGKKLVKNARKLGLRLKNSASWIGRNITKRESRTRQTMRLTRRQLIAIKRL